MGNALMAPDLIANGPFASDCPKGFQICEIKYPVTGTLKLEGLPGASLNGRSGRNGLRQNGAVAGQWAPAKSVQLADL